jgi:hypothetical protein
MPGDPIVVCEGQDGFVGWAMRLRPGAAPRDNAAAAIIDDLRQGR